MRYVVGIIAALGILLLLASGGESDVSGREREGFEEGPAQALVAAPAVDPAPVITIVEERDQDRERTQDRLPAETVAQLTEVRDLLTGAAGQSPEQAQPALEQAHERLDSALSQVETAVDEAPDRVAKIRLLHVQRLLQAIQTSIEARLEAA